MVEVLICTSIDGAEANSPEGNRGGIYLDAGFSDLNVGVVEVANFQGFWVLRVVFLMVSLWWMDGGLWSLVWWRRMCHGFGFFGCCRVRQFVGFGQGIQTTATADSLRE
jgi:hypothetical protein